MKKQFDAKVFALIAGMFVSLATATGVHAQTGNWDPYVHSVIISPAPLLPVEFSGTGVGTLKPGNNGGTVLPLGNPDGSNPNDLMVVTISLANGVPNVADPTNAVLALTALGGPGKIYWDWTYIPSSKTFRGVQNRPIPAYTAEEVTVQYKVTVNTFQAANPLVFNGLNVNISPPGYTNPQTADNDKAWAYTYVEARDYGDAPISYGAAVHTIDVTKNVGTGFYNRYMYLGPAVDPEDVYQASADAKGDDSNKTGGLGVNDESGVLFPAMTSGTTVNIQVKVTVWDWDPYATTWGSTVVQLRGWIDWPKDDTFTFDSPDRVVNYDLKSNLLDSEAAWTGPRSFTLAFPITIPSGVSGPYYARFRLGPALGPTAAADYGEVEDYRISTDVPTAVQLENFEAVARPDHVLVTWETVSEVSNTGFNLYRALGVDGERTLIATMPSQSPGGTSGAAYRYQDFDVQPGQTYWYYLEDLALSGLATLHGPVSVDFLGPVAVTLSVLKADAGQGAALWVVALAVAALLAAAATFVLRRRVTL